MPLRKAAAAMAGGMTENTAGVLAYVTFIPATIFLAMKPYNKSRFVRFHSFQCILLCAALLMIHIALGVVAVMIPVLVLLTIVLHVLASAATGFALIFLGVKANQGQMYKLLVIGGIAEKLADATETERNTRTTTAWATCFLAIVWRTVASSTSLDTDKGHIVPTSTERNRRSCMRTWRSMSRRFVQWVDRAPKS